MSQTLFKRKPFESEVIMLCVRWYLKYPLSYRMLVEWMQERGLKLTHTTIMRWVHQYSPIIDERVRKHLKPTNDSWRMDETYLKIRGKNAYLYRAVDSQGKTIDFFVSEYRDKDAATEIAIHEMIYSGILSVKTTLRRIKYLNNIVEQDHRFIKRKIKPMLGFDSFETDEKTICGIEVIHMIAEVEFINNIMGIAA